MPLKIKFENLKTILKAIRDQHISIAFQNKSGNWSNEYFRVAEIGNFAIGEATLEALILYVELDSPGSIVDIRSIHGLKLNKLLNLNGDLIEELSVSPAQRHEVLR
jgi:hypothetical protein